LSFFKELKRRHVFKVTIAYVVVAWLILQVADVILGNIGAPEWVFKVTLLFLCIGLPVIVMFAWAFDMTPDGLKRTESLDQAVTEKTSVKTKKEHGKKERGKKQKTSKTATPSGASVAVLPFVNMSGDKENEYFSDGLAEELLNVLAKIRSLKVAARTSSFHFKGQTGDIADIARRLGVASVLEGSVRKSGDRVRVTAQLINASDGFHLWSETFDRELTDIFAVQDEIASAVAIALKVKLLGEKIDHGIVGGTSNTEAYQAYLHGVHYQNRGSDKPALESARSSFEEAIKLDPEYAKAYAGLALVWDQLATNSFTKFEFGIGKVAESAAKAIELAPDLADSYLVLGRMLLHYKLDQRGAQKAINTALSLKPGNSEVQIEHARISSYLGDVDASVTAARKALELDPVSMFAHHFLGHVMYFGRRYEEAIPVFRHVLELDPHYPRPRYTMGMCLFMQGDAASALKEVEQEPLAWMKDSGSAILLHRLGRVAEAEATLAGLIREDDEEYAVYQQGQVHAQWGNADKAIAFLNRAYDLNDPGLSQILVDPLLDPIREHQHFKDLVSKIGFERLDAN